MTHSMRFACCVLLAACGSAPLESSVPAPDAGQACADSLTGPGYPHALLRIGCGGELLAGRAVWSREGTTVTLDFPGPTDGPVGADLVEAWPTLNEPPWLGHGVEDITVLSGGSVRVRFREPRGEPAQLFADHRLSGVPLAPHEGDARDAVDAGEAPLLTRHDASIEYARSLGRSVRMVAFDKLYLVVFAGEGGAAEAADLGLAISEDWALWGAEGARRAATVSWRTLGDQCDTSGTVAGPDAVRSRPAPADPTVSYPQGDLPALQIAERIVSATMRGDLRGNSARALTGFPSRLSVRPAGGPRVERAASDVAAVVRVEAGPGHPCSLYAEILRELAEWGPLDGTDRPNVILIGEAAVFEISRTVSSRVPGQVRGETGALGLDARASGGQVTWRR